MESEKIFTNRLINETSPYLLQHARNPVDWHPWGDEAFEKAKAEDKAVLVSIGYSACHWCHVMEHESFEDEATAAIMNEHFVNIKVDMEERPDVDQIYMSFVQMTTGRGGWPMNVFLTPDKRPFFGGTYFPPVSRYNMPGWPQILMSIAEAFREKRDELENSANDIVDELRKLSTVVAAQTGLSTDLLDAAFASFSRTFDSVNGGFGGAPKFPPAMSLEFLLRYHHRTGDERALAIVRHTCDKMVRGGIYDQLGGGFHRYAVDAIWLVPHFEKMLHDNAQLIRVYLHLYQILLSKKNPDATAPGSDIDADFYKRIAVETLEYVRREMLDESGGFYSTQDADSEGEEGKFFVWTQDEIQEILGKAEAEEFCAFYDVTAEGNFEDKNILNIPANENAGGNASVNERVSDADAEDTLPNGRVSARIQLSRKKLFDEREKRIKPNRDEKALTAWNGLMLAAFADAAGVLGRDDYLQIARNNADFILTQLEKDGRLLRAWKDGKAKLNGYLEDYANVADGLIVLYKVSGEAKYLTEAKRLADLMITEFWDDENGGFFFTSNDHEDLIVRNKDFYDNATPSGNSVAADVLLRLAKLFGDQRYERFAVTVLRLSASQLRPHPQGFGRALSALEFHLASTYEMVIAGPRGNDLEREILSKYMPNTVVALSHDAKSDSAFIPLLKDRKMVGGRAAVYVCKDFVCERPVTKVDEMRELIN